MKCMRRALNIGQKAFNCCNEGSPMREDDDVKKSKREKLFRFWTFVLIEASVLVIMNILARITPVCNWYTNHIFGWWSESYGRLTGLAPFSVGEILIYCAVALVVHAILFALGLIIWGRYKKYRHFIGHFMRFLLVFVLTVAIVLTMNLSFLYKTDKFNVKGNRDKVYHTEELLTMRNYLVEKCNALALQMERDDAGYVVWGGTSKRTREEIDDAIAKALRDKVEILPRLKGYFPHPKILMSSEIMYDIDTIGVFLPHSMEANVSALVDADNYPYTAAHELSHLKGYIYEDEANFIAYVALAESEDPYLQYSAYLNVLDYVNNDYYHSVDKDTYWEQLRITNLVVWDDGCYSQETIEEMEARRKKKEVISNVITNVSTQMTQGYLAYYQSSANYSEVTKLLMQYYDGILY